MAIVCMWVLSATGLALSFAGKSETAALAIIMAMLFYILKRLEEIEASVK